VNRSHFTLAERDAAEAYSKEIAEMLAVLGMEADDYLVSDESTLADFSTCCPESVDLEPGGMIRSTKDLRDRWEAWALQEYPRRFPDMPFEADFLHLPLVTLARRLRESREVHSC
jgi:glutathione S-transferase